MPISDIVIRGAREHNLRDVDVVLPRNQLICLTGVSGSGKSSLAFDTVYAEGQRRYVESLSSFARQFLGQMPKPDVDYIGGLSPSISISQKSAGNNPRSTVGTITEIYDYLRVLFARVGDGHCPRCHQPITAQSREQILARVLTLPDGMPVSILAPVIRGHKGEYRDLFEDYLKQGFVRARVDGQIVPLATDPQMDRQVRHNIEIVVDRVTIKSAARARLAEAIELALKIGKGNLIVNTSDGKESSERKSSERKSTARSASAGRRRSAARDAGREEDLVLSIDYACSDCGLSFEPPSPQLFSFNSPQGMCAECDGLGAIFSFDVDKLVPNPSISFKRGCFELLGPWKKMGRWRRHIFQGIADTVERMGDLPEGSMLETPWSELDQDLRDVWLWGAGDRHITYTWRGGRSPMKYGGKFEGIIPDLLQKYRDSKSRMQIRQLERFMNTIRCPDCDGQRLNAQARSVTIRSEHPRFADRPERSLPEVCRFPVQDAIDFFESLTLEGTNRLVASEAIKEIRGRLGFLRNVGLDYLSLDRTAPTLSGGESQRIRLAGQIGCGLVGVLYILDEPSIGLHPRDNDRLIDTLCDLRDLGNTVVVVEHDEDTMRASDHIIDFGPGPGVRGGELVASGRISDVMKAPRSLTGKYLSGEQSIEVPSTRRLAPNTQPIIAKELDENDKTSSFAARRRPGLSEVLPVLPPGSTWLTVTGARHNNLKGIDVSLPLGALVCVTGVSGSGKSSLVGDILVEALLSELNNGDGKPGAFDRLLGLQHLDKMISIDQSPIGRTPRSNPGTYIKLFDDIRALFTQLPGAKQRGYKPGRFSFNVDGGRCQACDGNGSTRLEMDFLADVWVTCPVCQGHRFNRETLAVQFKGNSIADVLEMDVQQALELFDNIPKIKHKLQTLHDVGLDYLKIGQPSPTLSGGEAQRIKLARELVKKSTGQTLYMLDEPTTGLHFHDIELLLKVLHGFVEVGNTVVVVEHNLDVIKTADWVIDLGPEGGAGGGEIVVAGTPEEVAACTTSHTGQALARVLSGQSGPAVKRARTRRVDAQHAQARMATHIKLRGARQHNLKGVDLKIARDEMTVFCGPSGSGKSSLAMDTIYAEGQRRYVESLSSYARQFVSQMQKPRLEHIEGLSPAIAIEQQNLGNTPRSTVGTSTEIYDYLRILMARLGTPHCPDCQLPVGTQTSDEIADKILAEADGTRLYLMAPIAIETGQSYEALWTELRTRGFHRVRVNGETMTLDDPPTIGRRRKHRVEVIVDRITVRQNARSRIAESIEVALSIGRGVLNVAYVTDEVGEASWQVKSHSQHRVCESCGKSFEALTPHNFSFNSYLGWCEMCEGLGTETGANPSALIRNRQMSLKEGAILLWPNIHREVSQWMLQALAVGARIPLDVPFEELDARQRRRILHGTDDQWFPVYQGGKKKARQSALFRFQFKGLYPALEEAGRLSPALRTKLEHLVDQVECSACGGSRLREDAAAVRFFDRTIEQLCRQPLGQFQQTVKAWKLTGPQQKVAGELLREIQGRVQFLNDVGLEYLTLARPAATLSGGEAQRIRLASQLGSGLCGVLYVLDEPTIGLHPRDNHRLIKALRKLRDLGNTLVLVEHDREVIAGSDEVVDFGPGAGRNGGQIVAQGTPQTIARCRKSVTGPYLSGKKAIPIPSNRRISEDDAACIVQTHQHIVAVAEMSEAAAEAAEAAEAERDGARVTTQTRAKTQPKTKTAAPRKSRAAKIVAATASGNHELLTVLDARHNNLQGVNVSIPLGTLTAITGVSGSGKSSLVNDVLYATLAKTLHRAGTVPGAHGGIVGLEHINKVVRVDQQPLGNSPTSNPATYTGAFDSIRMLFAQLPDAKVRGYTPRRFSFNVPGGRCEECEGNGQRCIEMHFLPDVWVPCEACRGQRYNDETLQVQFHGRSIADVLELTCGEALKLFENLPKIRRILQTLCDVGLDYLTLGQSAPTLSGGEAQRVKLAAELSRPDTGRTLYLLDEPTTGLHFDDLAKLLIVVNRLVDVGNTVVVIEHNLDVIKTADWIIDMGPEAGEAGGQITVTGTPEQVVQHVKQHGEMLAKKKTTRRSSSTKTPASKSRVAKSRAATTETPPPLVSLTGLALSGVLEDGPYKKREVYDPNRQEETSDQDLDISDVGKKSNMPWEIDGPLWHTKDRVGRKGESCHWDGRVLSEVVDRIHSLGDFGETNWNSRTIVEIAGTTKSHGWFLHAITGETWLLKLKFRTSKGSFRRDEIAEKFDLKTLNQMEDLPVYGNEPRVKCKSIRGPWQEVEFRIYRWDEIDTPEFWGFLEKAVAGFQQVTQHVAANPEEMMPWKKLGRKWHLARRGFPVGKKVVWKPQLLEDLCDLLGDVAGLRSEFLWNNRQLVHLYVAPQCRPWATLVTKRPEAIELALTGPKNRLGLGRIAGLGHEPTLDGHFDDYDVMHIQFRHHDDLDRGGLRKFLEEHLEGVRASLTNSS